MVADKQNSTVNVDVYYESLCPDSIYFITKELGPIYDQLKSVLKINLYPFGKASVSVNCVVEMNAGQYPTQ